MGPLVLVIEDDASIVRLYEMLLELIGLDVQKEVYMDGRSALARVQRMPPADIIILDLHLPYVQGQEIFKAAREHFKSAKIVIVSADVLAAEDMHASANQVFIKPLDTLVFKGYLEGLLR